MSKHTRHNDIGGVQSISRAAVLLNFIATKSRSGIRITDLSHLSSLPIPTVHRLLKALEAQRLIEQDPATRRYHIAPLVYELGLAARRNTPTLEECMPLLREVMESTGRPIHIVIQSGLDAVCIEHIINDRAFPIAGGAGVRRPIGAGAGGIILLAQKSQTEADEIITANMERYERMTSSANVEKVRYEVGRARNRGYAVSRCTLGICAVAVATPFGSSSMSVAAKFAFSHAESFEDTCRRLAMRLSAVTDRLRPILAS